jgi:hypothetical protein
MNNENIGFSDQDGNDAEWDDVRGIADPNGSPEDQLLRDEQGDDDLIDPEVSQPTLQDSRDPLTKFVYDQTVSFMAGYETKEDGINSSLEVVKGHPLQRVAKAVQDGNVEYAAAVSWITRFAHQFSKTVFFELYRREQRAKVALEQKSLPTMDRFSQSLQLQATIAALPKRLLGESPSQDQNALHMASETALYELLITENALHRLFHREMFRLAYQSYPTHSLGYLSVMAGPDQWVELEDFDEAKDVFVAMQDAKRTERAGRERRAAQGILASFAGGAA